MTPPLRSPLEVVGVVLEGAEGSAEGDSPVEDLTEEDLEGSAVEELGDLEEEGSIDLEEEDLIDLEEEEEDSTDSEDFRTRGNFLLFD